MLEPFVLLLVFISIIIVFGSAAYASLRAAPWLPVRNRDIGRIVTLARLSSQQVFFDLGSGDGRVLMALGRNCRARTIGYEVSVLPFLYSQIRLLTAGLHKCVEVRFADFFTADLSPADVVFCFLTPMAMKKIAPKFRAELKPGARVISYSFSIPGWVPERVDKPTEKSIPIFVYTL